MTSAFNEIAISIALAGVGVYFTIQSGYAVMQFLTFKRLRSHELLTWPAQRLPLHYLYRGLGVVSALLTLFFILRQDRFHYVLSQLVMAIYFLLLMPLTGRIRLGFYESGIWAASDFLLYERIGRFTFIERPEIVLLLLPRGGRRPLHLRIPAAEYSAVRKLLQTHIPDPDAPILGI